MNCKPGDLAIVVESCCGNEGRIVRCQRVVIGAPTESPDGSFSYEPYWETEPLLPCWNGRLACPLDSQLRPIRPQSDDAQDESARYLPPVPQVSAPMVTKEAAHG